MNLEKSQAISIGNIDNVQHSAAMKNGAFVNLGVKAKDDVYTVSVPATATLDTAEVLLVFSDESQYAEGTNISSFTNLADIPTPAYHLTQGDGWLIDIEDIDDTEAVGVGKFLSPVNGTTVPTVTVAKVGTKNVIEIIEVDQVIGFGRNPAIRVAVRSYL